VIGHPGSLARPPGILRYFAGRDRLDRQGSSRRGSSA